MRSIFPPPESADEEGLVTVGGPLNDKTLLDAYSNGIFPWPISVDLPLAWFSPDPRAVILPQDLRINSSLNKIISKNKFEFKINENFNDVIFRCAQHHHEKSKMGTWITPELMEAYKSLHKEGFSYSAETYLNGDLVGGMYGVCIDQFYSGESMFYDEDNASKFALVSFIQYLESKGIPLFDIQMLTPTTESLGGKYIKRSNFLEKLSSIINEAKPPKFT